MPDSNISSMKITDELNLEEKEELKTMEGVENFQWSHTTEIKQDNKDSSD